MDVKWCYFFFPFRYVSPKIFVLYVVNDPDLDISGKPCPGYGASFSSNPYIFSGIVFAFIERGFSQIELAMKSICRVMPHVPYPDRRGDV